MPLFSKVMYSGMICSALTLFACATGNPKTATASTKNYTEDLGVYRIRYQELADARKKHQLNEKTDPDAPVLINNDVTEKLHERLEAIHEKNKSSRIAQGFRVMVYSGNSSEEAKIAKELTYEAVPDENVYTVYRQPSFKVKVGNCFDRLEANYLLVEMKKIFPSAVIVPDQINIQ